MGTFSKENLLIFNIIDMNTKWKRLATILWLSSVVLTTWMWVYAAQNESASAEVLDKNRPPMMEQQIGSGEMMRPPRMEWFNPENFNPEEFDPENKMPRWWKVDRFWFAFIDQESLTDAQKSEIEKLQEERDEAIKKINDDFFDKLEKYISEDKLEDYEKFVENHENMKWMPHGKWRPEMRWESSMKNIQKPKESTNEQ